MFEGHVDIMFKNNLSCYIISHKRYPVCSHVQYLHEVSQVKFLLESYKKSDASLHHFRVMDVSHHDDMTCVPMCHIVMVENVHDSVHSSLVNK